jgi:serine/threonine-protein kinase
MDDVDPRIGSSVAGYQLEALIGRGGMSFVYLAEHVRLGRKVALKLLAPPLAKDESFRVRFERESQRAAEIDHPNIIPIYDAGEADGELYIAMKYVAGSDLKQLIAREKTLSVSRALFLLEQAAAALDAAHDRDLIHRDVKPANILVEDASERVYVTDFGVVKHTLTRGQTRTGFFVGTTDYAAPEQIEARDVDARTDVYSLGCVLYECLAGSPPFDRAADVAVMHAHLTQPPPLLSSVRSDLPKSLDRTIARAMAKDPDERYSTCSELMQAARAAALSSHSTDREARPVAAPTIASAATAGAVTAAAGTAAGQPPVSAGTAADQPLGTHETVVPEPVAAQATSAPTDQQPPDQPPPAAPPSTAGPPPSQGRGRSWLIGGLAAVAAAVAAGLIVFFVTRSDGEETASPPARTAAETTADPATTAQATTDSGAGTETGEATTAPAESGATNDLAALVPAEVFRRCGLATSPPAGATAAAVCVPSSGDEDNFPDQLELSIYPDAAALNEAYDRIAAEHDIQRDSGRCNGTNWGGERSWNHGPDRPGGRELCYFDGDDAVLVWSHEKLDQPNHHDLLGIARQGGLDHTALNTWWRFWTHRIGKTDE